MEGQITGSVGGLDAWLQKLLGVSCYSDLKGNVVATFTVGMLGGSLSPCSILNTYASRCKIICQNSYVAIIIHTYALTNGVHNFYSCFKEKNGNFPTTVIMVYITIHCRVAILQNLKNLVLDSALLPYYNFETVVALVTYF